MYRRNDVPFIGGYDDFYYETVSGKKFVDYDEDKFLKELDGEFEDYSPEFAEWLESQEPKLYPHEVPVAYAAWCGALNWKEKNGNRE